MGVLSHIATSEAEARAARERYVQVARRASRGGREASRRLCGAHAAFIRTMLRMGHPELALDAAHALLAACPDCPRSRALVERLRSRARETGRGENPRSSPVRNVSI